MKHIKFALFSLALIVLSFSSCTNDDAIIESPVNTLESASITTALTQLRTHFNADGSLRDGENTSGNIIFDFCFDFVYPLSLSYNNGTTVTVNSLDDLIEVMINSTQELYIDGISFPFDVETYNDETDAIEIQTINNEEEFILLLESCSFEFDICECFEIYEPVCVEIEDPSGYSFVITYPNACYAECDGFTDADFIDGCETDYNGSGGFECFTFNYPLTIITDDGTTITVNSEEELQIALYDVYYFDFEYPFSVTTSENVVIEINNENDFHMLLDECYGGGNTNPCDCTDDFNPVCVEVDDPQNPGNTIVFTFPNECYAICEGFTPNNFITCE